MNLINIQRKYFFKILISSFLLTACSSTTPEILNTPTIAIPTETMFPTAVSTETSTPIPTPTEFVIPDYAQEFFDGGYNTKTPNRPNSQYMLIRGTNHKFFDGIVINGVKVFDVIYGVGYIEEGRFYEDGIIINGACKEDRKGWFFTSIGGGSSISVNPICPTRLFFEGQAKGFAEMLPGDSDIIVALIGQEHENQSDRDKLFGNFFNGNKVVIPNVKGKVLNVQNYYFEAFEQP